MLSTEFSAETKLTAQVIGAKPILELIYLTILKMCSWPVMSLDTPTNTKVLIEKAPIATPRALTHTLTECLWKFLQRTLTQLAEEYQITVTHLIYFCDAQMNELCLRSSRVKQRQYCNQSLDTMLLIF